MELTILKLNVRENGDFLIFSNKNQQSENVVKIHILARKFCTSFHTGTPFGFYVIVSKKYSLEMINNFCEEKLNAQLIIV